MASLRKRQARNIVRHAIATDIQFASRFIGSLIKTDPEVGPVIIFCMIRYLSLFIYESDRTLRQANSPARVSLSPGAQAAVARSRHSLKLFEDTARGIEGQLRYYADEILPAHQEKLLNRTRFPPARIFETDLGLSHYQGQLITTTHASVFALGVEPQDMLPANSGDTLRAMATEYGQYLGDQGAVLDADAKSFANHIDPAQLTSKDVKSWQFYPRSFNGSGTPEINALLTSFQCAMNFVSGILLADSSADSRQTSLKIQFLTLYQVVRSLDVLRQERAAVLNRQSIDSIAAIVDEPTLQPLIQPPPVKQFRNTLMHYGLDTKQVNATQLSMSEPLYGLVELYFAGIDFDALKKLVETKARRIAEIMNEWSTAP